MQNKEIVNLETCIENHLDQYTQTVYGLLKVISGYRHDKDMDFLNNFSSWELKLIRDCIKESIVTIEEELDYESKNIKVSYYEIRKDFSSHNKILDEVSNVLTQRLIKNELDKTENNTTLFEEVYSHFGNECHCGGDALQCNDDCCPENQMCLKSVLTKLKTI